MRVDRLLLRVMAGLVVAVGGITGCGQMAGSPDGGDAAINPGDARGDHSAITQDAALDATAHDAIVYDSPSTIPDAVITDGPPLTPKYLLITAERLTQLQALVAANDPRWMALKANVDANLNGNCSSSAENAATVYLLTNDMTYANAAYQWAHQIVTPEDVRGDDYLYFGDEMRGVAMTLNYCYPVLTDAQRTELETFLDQWTNELWNNNMAGDWGITDPGSNYHYSFLEGTAFAGYALREAGNANAAMYLNILNTQITTPGQEGALDYMNGISVGGDWIEGANYGERTKQRMFNAFAAVATMDSVNYFTMSPFFSNSVYYQTYGTQPGHLYFYSGGDLARDSSMPVSPYDRAFMVVDAYFLADQTARGYAQWFLTNVVPDFTGPDFDDSSEDYLDFIFALNQPATDESSLPLSYRATGSNWVNLRSGWDQHATSISISGTPVINESHQHDDVGGFVIWHDDWQAADANTYSHSGEIWNGDAHNVINVENTDHFVDSLPGLTLFDDESNFSYVQVDGSDEYTANCTSALNEWTRELVYLRSSDVLVVYDRVNAMAGTTYDWRVHFPMQPTQNGGVFTSTNSGGSISLMPVSGGTPTIMADTDLADPQTTSFRVQEAPTASPGRLLNILRVATGAPPDVTSQHVMSTGTMEGLAWQDQVVMFSASARGAAPTLPLSYSFTGTGTMTHTLVNMSTPFNIAVSHSGSMTTVMLSAGNQVTPNASSVAQFTM